MHNVSDYGPLKCRKSPTSSKEPESNGQVVSSGDAQLRDTAFLDRPNRYFNHYILRYEKRMVDMWFERTILSGEHAAGR